MQVLCDSSAGNIVPIQSDLLNFKISKSPKKSYYFLDLINSYDSIINFAAKAYDNNEDCGETKGIEGNRKSIENLNKFNIFNIGEGTIIESECSKSDISRKSIKVNKNNDDNKNKDKKSSQKKSGNNCKKKTNLLTIILSKLYKRKH